MEKGRKKRLYICQSANSKKNIFSNVQINIAIMHIDTKMTSFKTRPTPIFGQYFLGGLG